MMKEKYETLPLTTLKELAKARGLKGISTMKKAQVIELMLQEDEKEQEKEELIDKLEDSSNFANTHSIIEQMLEIKEWSEDQKCKLFKIALENNQVTYILKDVDVKDFYRMICKNNNSEEAKRIKEIIYEKE